MGTKICTLGCSPIIIGLCLWFNYQVLCSEWVMEINNSKINFTDQFIASFSGCLSSGNTYCQAFYWNNYVDKIKPSENPQRSKPFVYSCSINYSWEYLSEYIQCSITETLWCNTENSSFSFGIIWKHNNVTLSNDIIRTRNARCCSYQDAYTVLVYNSISISTLTFNSNSTTWKSKFTSRATVPTHMSTNIALDITTLYSAIPVNYNITMNFTNIADDNDERAERNNIPVIVSVVVVVCIVALGCIVVGYIVWRRKKKTTILKSTKQPSNDELTEISSNEINVFRSSKAGTENQSFSSLYHNKCNIPHVLQNGNSKVIKDYSNCVIEEDYKTIAEKEGKAFMLNGDVCEDHSKNYNNTLINKSHTENNNSNYFNEETARWNTSAEVNVDYCNAVVKASSDYQSLGQERRDLKNTYHQLLQVEQEKQLALSDQELSPYTLAKPVLGKTTLQIIDVGTLVDNSCDTECTGEDQPYCNTPQDNDAPHEPSSDIVRDELGYSVVAKTNKG